MYSILIVEDAREIYEPLCRNLEREGYLTDVTTTQKGAIDRLEDMQKPYDLALVDLMLPDGHGFAVYQAAEARHIPVIFLTAIDDDYTLSTGFEMGAFDYIRKPYREKELLSRIRSALRKSGKLNTEIRCRDLRVDQTKGIAYKGDQELYLTRIEYRLFLVFMNNLGKTITRQRLIEEIWDITDEYITDNALSVHIMHLRTKLKEGTPDVEYIQTKHGLGYRMDP